MADADRYLLHYQKAIDRLGAHAGNNAQKPGISVKLSALYPRFETRQHHRAKEALIERLRMLAIQALSYDIGLTVDAEESWRLDLSLEVIEAVFRDPMLNNWSGFGLAIQAYQKHGYHVVEWAVSLATDVGRKLSVRLVKGAYWDTEIKYSQERGFSGYPVFTEKSATDVSYQACARLLIENRHCLYPQFATHNAYSLAMIIEMSQLSEVDGEYEFQRLHGMGEELYDDLVKDGIRCRIYAPVGEHADLLAYLVRRLLENGANTSFVNNIQNSALPIDQLLEDPVKRSASSLFSIPLPADIYQPHRKNSPGFNLDDFDTLFAMSTRLERWWLERQKSAEEVDGVTVVRNPASRAEVVGHLNFDRAAAMRSKLTLVHSGQSDWSAKPVEARAEILLQVAEHLADHSETYMGFCIKEAGKTLDDASAELREAIDFCRYYAAEALTLKGAPLGTVLCISPWNFPLAIFLGQISAALVAGNTVLAKPAEQTSLVAAQVVRAMHTCGVPESALQLVVSEGREVSNVLVADARVSGVMFTGSSATASVIASVLHDRGEGPLSFIAETGGMNAMIVDSTALPEQVVDDVVASCFHSAGQRCSALRILYVQDDVAEAVIEKIQGKMAGLVMGDPSSFHTDIGPIIDETALARLEAHITHLDAGGARLLYRCEHLEQSDQGGCFFAPAFYEIDNLTLLEEEVFGPVLHLRRYRQGDLEAVLDEINGTGYGLTLGIHSRIEGRCEAVANLARVGNVYVNRNMVGAIVGVQPFGGRGRSGTGPKAGGPAYLPALLKTEIDMEASTAIEIEFGEYHVDASFEGAVADWHLTGVAERVQRVRLMLLSWLLELEDTDPVRFSTLDVDRVLVQFSKISDWLQKNAEAHLMVSPTGETNSLSWWPLGTVCLVADQCDETVILQLVTSLASGNGVAYAPQPGALDPPIDSELSPLIKYREGLAPEADAMAIPADLTVYSTIKNLALSKRADLVPIIAGIADPARFMVEKTITIDTTAAGGNASLLARASG